MRVVILGGGISGLSAAWFLRKRFPGWEIVLLEERERLGGRVETRREGGFCFERGPRTVVYGRSPRLVQLIEELGLGGRMVPSSREAKRRFLWSGGSLRSVGSFWPMLLCAAVREWWVEKGSGEDESIESFASRRFGQKVARRLFDPLALGIYAGDISRLSIRSCFPTLWQFEREKGSVVRGMMKRKKRAPMELFSLEGGLQTLIDALQRQLSIEVALNCCVKGVGARVVTSRGDFAGDLIVSALPAEEISRALGVELEVPCRSLWVVHLGFSGKVLKRKGFGYLVPTEENERILGMVWDSEIFPGGSETRLTAMIREESEAPVEDALDALRRHLGIEEKPEFISSHFALRAIPQFEVGHKEKIARFEETIARQFPHVLLTGNYLDGASLEACVARSWALLEDKRLKALQPQSEEDC